jgi:hypothetical protein
MYLCIDLLFCCLLCVYRVRPLFVGKYIKIRFVVFPFPNKCAFKLVLLGNKLRHISYCIALKAKVADQEQPPRSIAGIMNPVQY